MNNEEKIIKRLKKFADLINKAAFGLFIWAAAKSEAAKA